MTIEQALEQYANGLVVVDKLVWQYVDETNGSRVVYQFVIDSSHLYLRKTVMQSFNKTEEQFELFDTDVKDALLEFISNFTTASDKLYDIFNRDVVIPVNELFEEAVITEHGLENASFKTY